MMKRFLLLLLIAIPAQNGLAQEQDSAAPDQAEIQEDLKTQAEVIKKSILSGSPKFTLVGILDKGSKSDFSINGEDFVIDSDARIVGQMKVGAYANVRGDRIGDRNYAKRILIGEDSKRSDKQPDFSNSDAELPSSGPKGLRGQKVPK